jgi:hypothetical protein
MRLLKKGSLTSKPFMRFRYFNLSVRNPVKPLVQMNLKSKLKRVELLNCITITFLLDKGVGRRGTN